MNKKQLYDSIMHSVSREVKKVLNETYADDLRKYNKDKIYWDECKHTASARDIWSSMSYEKFRNGGNEDINYQTYLEIMDNIKNKIAFHDTHPEKPTPPEMPEKWDGDFLCNHYCYYNKCNKMDVSEVQDLTHWDEDFCNNDYYISDEAFDKIIYIIPFEQFDKMTEGEYKPKEKNIEYCAYNYWRDIVYCFDKKGIHWFYN